MVRQTDRDPLIDSERWESETCEPENEIGCTEVLFDQKNFSKNEYPKVA